MSGQHADLGVNAAPDPKCSCRNPRRIYGSSTKPLATSDLDGRNHLTKGKTKTTAKATARATTKAKTQLREKHLHAQAGLPTRTGWTASEIPKSPKNKNNSSLDKRRFHTRRVTPKTDAVGSALLGCWIRYGTEHHPGSKATPEGALRLDQDGGSLRFTRPQLEDRTAR